MRDQKAALMMVGSGPAHGESLAANSARDGAAWGFAMFPAIGAGDLGKSVVGSSASQATPSRALLAATGPPDLG